MRVVESVARTLRAVDADARLARVEDLLRDVMARLDEIDRRREVKITSEKQAPPMDQDAARGRPVAPQPADGLANTSKEQAERVPADHPARPVAAAPQPVAPKNTSAEQAEPTDPDAYLGPMPDGVTPQQMAELVRTARSIGARIDAMEQALLRATVEGSPPARSPWPSFGSLAATGPLDEAAIRRALSRQAA